MKTLLCFFLLFLFIQDTRAQTIGNFTILPQSPTNFTPVKIATYITTGNLSIFISKSFTVNSQQNIIQLEACYYMGMANAFGEYIDTFAVGNLNPGNYTILFKLNMSSASGSCAPGYSTSATENFTVGQTATSLHENNALNGFNIYPNPTKDKLHLEFFQPGSASTVSIFNVLGYTVYKQEAMSEKTEINLGNLPAGVYFIQVEQGGRQKTTRFIKAL